MLISVLVLGSVISDEPAEKKGRDDWDLMEYRIPTKVFYPQSPQLAKMWIEKVEDWVQLQTELTWRPLHLDRWTNSAFLILGPVATYPNFCHFVYDRRQDVRQYASKYSTNDWKRGNIQHLQQSSYQISVQATLACSFAKGFPAGHNSESHTLMIYLMQYRCITGSHRFSGQRLICDFNNVSSRLSQG